MNTNTNTQLCCIIGDPVEHSLSPVIHNAAYEAMHANFVYLAFRVTNIQPAIDGIKSLGIRGISVTVPHKVSVIKYMDALDPTAKAIGAVNTIVNNNGKLTGYNTDYSGALAALEEKTTLAGKRVVILGAGGTSRAIAFGLKKKGAQLTILNRTREKAAILAQEVLANYGDLSELTIIQNADILIHTTTTGLAPKQHETLVPKEYLRKDLVVFDIVYNPKETQLLKDAKEVGCKIIYGYKMLLYQAALQFELFTETKPPVSIMEKVLVENLKSKI